MILVSQGWPQGCAQPYFYILDESWFCLSPLYRGIVCSWLFGKF